LGKKKKDAEGKGVIQTKNCQQKKNKQTKQKKETKTRSILNLEPHLKLPKKNRTVGKSAGEDNQPTGDVINPGGHGEDQQISN